MRFLSRAGLTFGLGIVFLIGTSAGADAAETASSDLVIIRADVVIDDDLYATGNKVLIEGIVDGDLIAFAADEIVISGEVTGSVHAVAPRVVVTGTVGGSLRATSTSVNVEGSISKDAVVVSYNARFGPESDVGGDVLVWAVNATATGSIGGDLGGTQGDLELSGSVDGDVDVTVAKLTVTGPLEVGEDLSYRSDSEAAGLENVEVGGVVVHKTPTPPNIRVRALGLFARFLVVLALTGTALLVSWGWPSRTARAEELAASSYFKAYAIGALIFFSPVLLAGGVAVLIAVAPTAALPLVAILSPLVLALGGVVLVLSLVAGVPAVLRLGKVLPGDFEMPGSILAGSAVVGLIWLLPIVGWLVPLIVLPLGLGAWGLSFRTR